jgi:hypothetical protein
VLPTAAGSIPATASGVAAITFAAGHFDKLVNREFVDFDVQIGHVTLLFLGGAVPSHAPWTRRHDTPFSAVHGPCDAGHQPLPRGLLLGEKQGAVTTAGFSCNERGP